MANSRKDSKGRVLRKGESQRKDGTYMYRYSDPITLKRKSIYGNTLQLLREKEKAIESDIVNNILTTTEAKKMTFNALYIHSMNGRALAPQSRINYDRTWKNRVQPELGNMRVVAITATSIKKLYSDLAKKNYSMGTIKFVHHLIKSCLDTAVEDHIIKENPARRIKVKKYGKAPKKTIILTLEQQDRLIQFARQQKNMQRFVPALIMLLKCCLREGELLGLTLSDIDLEKKILIVDHQIEYYNEGDGYKLHIGPPKSDSGERIIPLTQDAVAALHEQIKRISDKGYLPTQEIEGYSNFIFITSRRVPYTPNAFSLAIKHVISSYNDYETLQASQENRKPQLLPVIPPHGLRHTGCTNYARLGINPKTLQYFMGHSSIHVTMDIYNHLDNTEDILAELQRLSQAAV